MSRNKYPEETVARILDAARRLFLEKGYEQTSIQDILNELGDLSKGAIYHHFKSKDDIMLAVIDHTFQNHDDEWAVIAETSDLTGLERLIKMFKVSINSPRQMEIFSTAPDFLKNPKMLAMQMQSIMGSTAPQYIRPIIEMGVADGSIATDYPEQLAEVILLLMNLWLSPLVFFDDISVMRNRYHFFADMLKKLGIDLGDDEILRRLEEFWQAYSEKRAQQPPV